MIAAWHHAYHLADDFALTLTDLSAAMLRHAQRVCLGAEVVRGDMRTLRLGRTFDAVFAHDALCSMLTADDLRAVCRTARAPPRPGGVRLLLAPDDFVENGEPGREEGGRALHDLAWVWRPAGVTARDVVAHAIVTREGDAAPVRHHDRQEEGLLSRAHGIACLEAEGFAVEALTWHPAEVDRPLTLLRARWEGVG